MSALGNFQTSARGHDVRFALNETDIRQLGLLRPKRANPEELRVGKSRPRCAEEQTSSRGVDLCRKSDAARTSRIVIVPF
jgi:hypothetical protein